MESARSKNRTRNTDRRRLDLGQFNLGFVKLFRNFFHVALDSFVLPGYRKNEYWAYELKRKASDHICLPGIV